MPLEYRRYARDKKTIGVLSAMPWLWIIVVLVFACWIISRQNGKSQNGCYFVRHGKGDHDIACAAGIADICSIA